MLIMLMLIMIILLPLGDLDGRPVGLAGSSGTDHPSNEEQGDEGGRQDNEGQKNGDVTEADAARYTEAEH